MKIIKNIIQFIMIASVSYEALAIPEDPQELETWEKRMLLAVERQREKPPEEAIPQLGMWVMQLSLPHHKEREGRPVFMSAQRLLISIPGHAEYYGEKVDETKRIYAETLDNPPLIGLLGSRLYAVQSEARRTLSLLPSPETVRVAGAWLDDTWQHPVIQELGSRHDTNAGLGYGVLSRLPIVNPPPKGRDGQTSEEILAPWRLWYEQIKSGNRTFRFEGDPTEYDLHGPAPKEKLDRIARHQARDSQRAKGRRTPAGTEAETSADSSGKSGVSVTVGILAALLLLGSAMWYWKNSAVRIP